MSHSKYEAQPDGNTIATDKLRMVELAVTMQPSNILGYDDEDKLCQLWYCQSTGQTDWRKIGYISEMET